MKSDISRRNFFKKSTQAGLASCALLMSSKLNAMDSLLLFGDDEKIDPKLLNYCGYKCPKDCKFNQATLKNDDKLKKEAHELWKIKDKYGIDFDPEKSFCYGCKVEDKPAGVVTANCTVRECAMEKKHDCCIECKELKTCDKYLWKQFPTFHEQVVEMQKKYLAQK